MFNDKILDIWLINVGFSFVLLLLFFFYFENYIILSIICLGYNWYNAHYNARSLLPQLIILVSCLFAVSDVFLVKITDFYHMTLNETFCV